MTNFTFYGGRKLSSEKSKRIGIIPMKTERTLASVFVLRSQCLYYPNDWLQESVIISCCLIESMTYWKELASWPTDWLNDWLTKIGFCHDESINSIYDHKKTQSNADVSSVSPSSKFSLKPRLQGSAQIIERIKTCRDPPFVYTGPAEPCTKLLNGKVCKFFTWSEVGQNFWRVPLFCRLAEVSFRKTREKIPLLAENPLSLLEPRENTWRCKYLHSLRGKSPEHSYAPLNNPFQCWNYEKFFTDLCQQNCNRICTVPCKQVTQLKKIRSFKNLPGLLWTEHANTDVCALSDRNCILMTCLYYSS